MSLEKRIAIPVMYVTLSNLYMFPSLTDSFSSCQGAPGVSNTAGAALWTLDYLLYAYVPIPSSSEFNISHQPTADPRSGFRESSSIKGSASSTALYVLLSGYCSVPPLKFRKPRFNQQLYTVRHSMGQLYPDHFHRTSKLNTMPRSSQLKQSVTLGEPVL